jgi:enoyl-[acyl-carrier protein] reductase II
VSSAESPVHANYKQAILDAPETGTLMLNKSGTPCVRALKTQRSQGIYQAGAMPKETFGKILDLYFGGDMEASVALAGQTAGLIDEIKPVEQIIQGTINGFFDICKRMGGLNQAHDFG